MIDIAKRIAEELSVSKGQVEKTIALIDEGNTIPFIARYRKEITGNLTDEQLRVLETQLTSLRNLEARKEEVLRLITEQEKMTPELAQKIAESETLKAVEDLYLPYRPKKRTRASMARDRGLESLSVHILHWKEGDPDIETLAKEYLNEEVDSIEAAIQGAKDIIAEQIAEEADNRDIVRQNAWNSGVIRTLKSPKADPEAAAVYEMYFDSKEKLDKLPAHRILAINRAEKEGAIRVGIDLSDERNTFRIFRGVQREVGLLSNGKTTPLVEEALDDGYKRLLFPSIETEVRQELTQKADQESIQVFAKNLKPYLMQPPLKGAVVMGLDPGFRTGCKLAVISDMGEVLDFATIYPTAPHNRVKESIRTMETMVRKHGVNVVAIGNGTASRETEMVVQELIRESANKKLAYVIVNESGASIYSASKLGTEEFPDLDVTIRGAISIARRLQDPLAELVKIEPKHIGVGQYQHDVNQKALEETLENVVEDCVNAVGVNVNTASASLLSYVAGVSKTVAKNIISYKEENGGFQSRSDLKKVKGLGPKAFTQCAGFLRIPEGKDPLDNTGVHPESYDVARKLYGRDLNQIDWKKTAEELAVGVPTLQDIVQELKKPGRDPREEMPKPILRTDVLSMDDIEVGMEMMGTVRNVVDFGCFVDIGVHQDGLVHISQMSDTFLKKPSEYVQVSDIVKVRVIEIDKKRDRISLSMKGFEENRKYAKRRTKG